jgi:uridine kinase
MHPALLNNLTALLRNRNVSAPPTLLLIDGPAGAGKTTLAREVLSTFGFGEIIHCDDLYNGWEDALTPTLEKTIREQIIKPLHNSEPIHYLKYDWRAGRYGERITVPATPLIILEGVGCALPGVTPSAELSIWIDIPFELGLERVLKRDGTHIQKEMFTWIARQEEFFSENQNRANCTIHLPYGAPAQP